MQSFLVLASLVSELAGEGGSLTLQKHLRLLRVKMGPFRKFFWPGGNLLVSLPKKSSFLPFYVPL